MSIFNKVYNLAADKYNEMMDLLESVRLELILTREEIAELKNQLAETNVKKVSSKLAIEKNIIKDDEKYIRQVMKKAGWTFEKAQTEMGLAKQRFGISYKEYSRNGFYSIPEEEQEKKYEDIVNKARRRKRRIEKKEKLIHTVMEQTGWDYDQAKEKMDRSTAVCGAEYKDYVAYKFWELEEETQKTYFTKGDANALRKKYNTNKENLDYFMNKNQFNEVFESYLGRPWLYNRNITLENFKEKFGNEPKIMYKPLAASCGSGITVFEINESNIEKVYESLMDMPLGVLEGYITQHQEMSKFSRNSVNTIRMVTIYANHKVNMLYAAFRMGGGDAVVDNFHNGGVLALIDLETGIVVTDAIDLNANRYVYHPATNEKIVGFKIPYWKEAVKMLEEAGKLVEGVGYVGWDVAITEKGPVLIEGNTAPAPNVLQLPYSLLGKGMHHVVEPYL